jgi:protein gp37
MGNRLAAMNTKGYQSVIDGYWDGYAHVCEGWNGSCYFVESALTKPLHWRKPRMIFVCSMGDLFHESVPFEWVDKVLAIIRQCSQHTFQVLTKRSARMLEYFSPDNPRYSARKVADLLPAGFPGRFDADMYWPIDNLWLGVTAEDQQRDDERIPDLLKCPAAKRFVSCEPLLGEIDLTSVEWPNKNGHRVDVLRAGYWNAEGYRYGGPSAELGAKRGLFTNHSDMERLDWVICGGESGPGARPMHPDNARSLRDQCKEAGVPFFFKQMGGHPKKRAKLEEIPEDLRVREYPKEIK